MKTELLSEILFQHTEKVIMWFDWLKKFQKHSTQTKEVEHSQSEATFHDKKKAPITVLLF